MTFKLRVIKLIDGYSEEVANIEDCIREGNFEEEDKITQSILDDVILDLEGVLEDEV